MKAINIDKTSWHYKLVDTTTDWSNGIEFGKLHADICTYTRHFLKALFKVTFVTLAVVCVAITTLSPIFYFIAHTFFGDVSKFNLLETIGIMMWGAAAAFSIIWLVTEKIAPIIVNRKSKYRTNRKPGIIKQMYKHLHDKTCAPLNIE
jgi:hypothetical protein